MDYSCELSFSRYRARIFIRALLQYNLGVYTCERPRGGVFSQPRCLPVVPIVMGRRISLYYMFQTTLWSLGRHYRLMSGNRFVNSKEYCITLCYYNLQSNAQNKLTRP